MGLYSVLLYCFDALSAWRGVVAVAAKRYDLAVFKLFAVNGKPYQRAVFVPSLHTGCPGVDVEQVESLVKLHLQYMAVPADEELRRHGEYL